MCLDEQAALVAFFSPRSETFLLNSANLALSDVALKKKKKETRADFRKQHVKMDAIKKKALVRRTGNESVILM